MSETTATETPEQEAKRKQDFFLLQMALRASRNGTYVYKNCPKAGCSSIKRALWLAEVEAGTLSADIDPDPLLHEVNGDTPWTMNPNAVWGKLVFTFTRNPYERVYSAYINKCVLTPRDEPEKILQPLRKIGVGKEPVSFGRFLEFVNNQKDENRDPHWQTQYLASAEPFLASHYIGALETIQEDLTEVFSVIFPGQTPQLKIMNSVKPHGEVAPRPTRDELDFARQIYADDFEVYRYHRTPELAHMPPYRARWADKETRERFKP